MEDVQWPAEAAVIDERLKMKPYSHPGSIIRASALSIHHMAGDSLSSEASGLSSYAQQDSMAPTVSEALARSQSAGTPLWSSAGAGPTASNQRCATPDGPRSHNTA